MRFHLNQKSTISSLLTISLLISSRFFDFTEEQKHGRETANTISPNRWNQISKVVLNKEKYNIIDRMFKIKFSEKNKKQEREIKDFKQARDKILYANEQIKRKEKENKKIIAKTRRLAVNKNIMSNLIKRKTMRDMQQKFQIKQEQLEMSIKKISERKNKS